mmetsp:Transcript_111663/g.218884  ORF Transcript_111663/g.218884 Transcript_111663/m.218884 type:complete len:315 (-) Transcript_111663:1273-2217(-)
MATFNDKQVVGYAPVSETSFEWLYADIAKVTGKTPTSASLVDFSGMGGLSGAVMRRLIVKFDDETEQKFVYKTILPAGQESSKNLGLPREAFFFAHLASTLVAKGVPLPNVVFTHGDMNTGEKTIILEDLSEVSVQSGYFFGSGSPHNWDKELLAIIGKNRPAAMTETITMVDITRAAFRTAASIHATYWQDRSLLEHKWLRSQDWVQGQGEDTWQAAQDHSSSLWAKTLEKIAAGTSGVNWDSRLLACMDASISRISWEAYQKRVQSSDYFWTLVHGDFHPANILWRWPDAAELNSSSSGSSSSRWRKSGRKY